MRDEQLEKRIADAVQHAAPDVLDRILSSYDEQKGNVISMSEIVNTNNKRNKRRWTSLMAVAAALALCVSVFGYNFWKSGSAVDSVVLLHLLLALGPGGAHAAVGKSAAGTVTHSRFLL